MFAESEAAAIAELKKLHRRSLAGNVLDTSSPTLAQFLEEWFQTNSDDWRPSTRRSYRSTIDGGTGTIGVN